MRLQALFLVLLWPVCAPLMQPGGRRRREEISGGGDRLRTGQVRRGACYVSRLRKTRLHRAAQAQFNAAHILVYYKNPDKDYSREAREFGEFPSRYPAGTFAGEARSRLDVLRNFEQSKTNELLKEVDSFTRKMEAVTQELQRLEPMRKRPPKNGTCFSSGKTTPPEKSTIC